MEGCGAPAAPLVCDPTIAIELLLKAAPTPRAKIFRLLRIAPGLLPFPISTPSFRVASRLVSWRLRCDLGACGGASGVTPSPLQLRIPARSVTPAERLRGRDGRKIQEVSRGGDKLRRVRGEDTLP